MQCIWDILDGLLEEWLVSDIPLCFCADVLIMYSVICVEFDTDFECKHLDGSVASLKMLEAIEGIFTEADCFLERGAEM